MFRREDALEYHGGRPAGLIAVHPTKACLTAREMRLAYLPGAAMASQAIRADAGAAVLFTARANQVAIVTDGSAVPGLGDVGPLAAKPVQEGIALLFKRLADIDAFDLELDVHDPARLADVIGALHAGLGAIVLSNIRAPLGLDVHDRLRETLPVPVFHENLQSTAVVAVAALINAADLAGKDTGQLRIVVSGAGTVGLGCARLLAALGVAPAQLALYDVHGLVHPDRDDLTSHQRVFARREAARSLAEAMRGADVFIGASAAGIATEDMVRSMARFPIVLALGTPEPEIGYEVARASRHDAIVATGVARSPNAILDFLSFPYVLRGALDAGARCITDGMLLAAARALAELAREDVVDDVSRAYGAERLGYGPEYLLPKPIDPRIFVTESAAVARQAVEEGVARIALEPEPYRESLRVRIGTGRDTLRRLMLAARRECPTIVFPEGTSDTILRASRIMADEGIARPVLLGREGDVRAAMQRLGLEPSSVRIVDPDASERLDAYAGEYFRLRCRRGLMRATAVDRVRRPEYFAALMLHSGDADLMISGVASHFSDSMRVILDVIGPAPGVRRISSHYMALLPRRVLFLADCAVNIEPDAETLAEIALVTAGRVRALGFEPRVAMLSFSNFGSVDHALARKVRRATEIARAQAPGLAIDGEMQLATAIGGDIRAEYFPFSSLPTDANVLVFPGLESGNLAMHLLQHIGDAVVIGPVLSGARLPAHLVQYGGTAQEVVNLAVVGIVEASGLRDGASGAAAETR